MFVYSTSPASSFQIDRTDGIETEENMFITLDPELMSPFSILVEYNVKIVSITDELSRTYAVSVTNEENETVIENIQIIRATGTVLSL